MSDLFFELSTIFKNVLDYSGEITDECKIDKVTTWDSLSHITLIFAIEEYFDLSISEEEMAEMISFNKILDILSKKIKS